MYDEEEVTRRPALQLIMEKLKRHNVDVPSITYLRRHFDPKWPGVAEWLDEITPAYNRLVNAIWAVYDPTAIVFGGQIPPALAELMIERTQLFGKPRYGVWRASPKLIVSEIKPDAAAMGHAATPFKLTFFWGDSLLTTAADSEKIGCAPISAVDPDMSHLSIEIKGGAGGRGRTGTPLGTGF
ncbi:ROK family protein [Rhizobium rhizogenes]|uniref:ROK family protein n=1 Tax=Rhizobium rhizogenes TaxID=359 RepID=UPI001573C9FB|nr:ROK family protein [Rhizobium rhizogenes]